MALEIRELIIKTTISDQSVRNEPVPLSQKSLEILKADIVNECMDMIQDEMSRKKER